MFNLVQSTPMHLPLVVPLGTHALLYMFLLTYLDLTIMTWPNILDNKTRFYSWKYHKV